MTSLKGSFLIVNITLDVMPDFEPQLAVKKQKKLPTINGPGLFWMLIILVLVLFGLAVIMLGKSQNPVTDLPTPAESVLAEIKPSRIYTVSYKSGVFSPTNLRIHAGDTVRFKNESFFPIKIVSGPDSSLVGLDSVGDIPQGSYFSFTFAAKGIFDYHNDRSPKETGTIIVR
jgi:plastocyanin